MSTRISMHYKVAGERVNELGSRFERSDDPRPLWRQPIDRHAACSTCDE